MSSSPGPTAAKTRVRKSPIQKTRTFNGCWTCRRRKVKCDLARPVCTRCTKGGHHCDGYGLLLHWTESNVSFAEADFAIVRGNAIKRKAMSSPRSASWQLDMDKVSELLTEIDELDPIVDQVMGPFSIFRGYDRSHGSTLAEHTGQLVYRNDAIIKMDTDPPLSPLVITPETRLQVYPQVQVLPDVFSTGCGVLSASRIFHHYTDHVAHLLQPVLHSGNFYSTVYIPRAISGAWDLVSGHSASTASWSTRSIFFSVLATSAFHLRGVESLVRHTSFCGPRNAETSVEMNAIGRSCRIMAYTSLRRALSEGLDSLDAVEAAMSAILSFISIDIMHGSMSEFPLHLSAFCALQLQYREKYRNGSDRTQSMVSTPAEKYLNTIFYLQSTLSLSTDCDLTPVPWPTHPPRASRREASLYAIPALDDDCLQYTYGTSRQISLFIRAAVTLFRSVSYYASDGDGVPESLYQAIRNLSEKLNAWRIDSENIINFPCSEMGQVMKMHILAFHNATCIFVLTHLMLPLSADPEARWSLSDQIRFHSSQALSRLQSIEDIKQQTSPVFHHQTASILWPGFIASCEAVQEYRPGWIAWWEQMLTYRIGNIASLYETVVDVWQLADRRQNSSSSLPAWRILLREKGRVIIAL